MSSKSIDISLLGQVLRLSCPVGQEVALRQAAVQLEQRVIELRERSKIVNLDRLLSIVALNLLFELQPAQEKSAQAEQLQQQLAQTVGALKNAEQLNADLIKEKRDAESKIQQLDASIAHLTNVLANALNGATNQRSVDLDVENLPNPTSQSS